MLATFVVQLLNKPGVLERVAGVVRRRGFEIQSLTIGQTEMPGTLRMTLLVEADEDRAARLKANLYKLPEVVRVDNVTSALTVIRELAIIKVAAIREERAEIIQTAAIFRAQVIDVCPGSIVIEITGSEVKINGLIEILAAYGIVEIARTGWVAMTRGLKPMQCKDKVATEPC